MHKCWEIWPTSLWCWPTAHKVLAITRTPWWLEKSKHHEYFWEGQAGGYTERWVSCRDDYGASPPWNHIHMHEGQEGDLDQSAWIYQSQTRLECLRHFDDWFSGQRESGVPIYIGTSFNTISHIILKAKLEKYNLNTKTTCWVEIGPPLSKVWTTSKGLFLPQPFA